MGGIRLLKPAPFLAPQLLHRSEIAVILSPLLPISFRFVPTSVEIFGEIFKPLGTEAGLSIDPRDEMADPAPRQPPMLFCSTWGSWITVRLNVPAMYSRYPNGIHASFAFLPPILHPKHGAQEWLIDTVTVCCPADEIVLILQRPRSRYPRKHQ